VHIKSKEIVLLKLSVAAGCCLHRQRFFPSVTVFFQDVTLQSHPGPCLLGKDNICEKQKRLQENWQRYQDELCKARDTRSTPLVVWTKSEVFGHCRFTEQTKVVNEGSDADDADDNAEETASGTRSAAIQQFF
jgi:hypothetical protein